MGLTGRKAISPAGTFFVRPSSVADLRRILLRRQQDVTNREDAITAPTRNPDGSEAGPLGQVLDLRRVTEGSSEEA